MQLFIDSYGTYIHVKDEMFEVRVKKDGEYQKHHYSAKKVTGIVLSPGVALSSDAVKLAVYHNVDILFIENNGRPLGRVWHSKLGSTSKIRKAQLNASTGEQGVYWIKQWIGRKITNQLDFLKDLKKHRKNNEEMLDEKIGQIGNLLESVKALEGNKMEDIDGSIRGLEGTAGRIYFSTLSELLTKNYRFNGRSYRPAKDPFNAFLNYAYGVLYGKIEKALIVAGLDPYLGFLHRDDYNQLSFVFDFIEPYRIHADRVIFRLFSGKKVNKDHTEEITNGFSLNKAGKELLLGSFNKYLEEEKVLHNRRKLVRSHIIQAEAHAFANHLIQS